MDVQKRFNDGPELQDSQQSMANSTTKQDQEGTANARFNLVYLRPQFVNEGKDTAASSPIFPLGRKPRRHLPAYYFGILKIHLLTQTVPPLDAIDRSQRLFKQTISTYFKCVTVGPDSNTSRRAGIRRGPSGVPSSISHRLIALRVDAGSLACSFAEFPLSRGADRLRPIQYSVLLLAKGRHPFSAESMEGRSRGSSQQYPGLLAHLPCGHCIRRSSFLDSAKTINQGITTVLLPCSLKASCQILITQMASTSRDSVSSHRSPLLRRSFSGLDDSLGVEESSNDLIHSQYELSLSSWDSNSTMSSRPGLGRTLDRPLRKAGDAVVAMISRMCEDMGRGPNALMARMLTSGEWGAHRCHSLFCRVYQDSLGPAVLWSCPSIEKILDILFSPYCQKCRECYALSLVRDEIFTEGCRKLVQGIRGSNQSIQRLCAHYVCALSHFHPSFRQQLLRSGAQEALEELCTAAILWREDLLARPATNALDSLSKTLLLPVIKDFSASKLRVDEYYPCPLSEGDLSSMEPKTWECVTELLYYLSLTQMIAPLAKALDAEVVEWLWSELLSSRDPVARGVLGRLICNLYDFLSYAAFTNRWDTESGVQAGVWLWTNLWIPFFRLAWNYSVPLGAFPQAERFCRSAPNTKPQLLRKDPIECLGQKIASPLFFVAAILEKERRVSGNLNLHAIDRAVPRGVLQETSKQIAQILLSCNNPANDIAFLNPVLKSAVPWYDTVCRFEVRRALKGYLSHTNPLLRRNAKLARALLNIDVTCYELRCSGIVVGVLEGGPPHGLCVLDEHEGLPYRPDQNYRDEFPVRRLVASSIWRDIRWVPCAEIDLRSSFYEPLTIVFHGEAYHIVCKRDTSLRTPHLGLLPLTSQPAAISHDAADVGSLHILCAVVTGPPGSCPVFWQVGPVEPVNLTFRGATPANRKGENACSMNEAGQIMLTVTIRGELGFSLSKG
ncbi:hypothetical protein GLOTRDRAFT_93627 [Gloeophyllum trabeum ATCC 11539]|uniref:Uncharacterized protein n=1 Tax=Gloeophyllum trabeum (strain ATCC 11539 / FP-39264 / Madison 617) TaxID=670483 RepID=S7RL34_GLOTA|nr:uncharacterized protein GLOTRDRAFT_93627 [Gloeophyllum trabeum ATCC 11539]EPQ55075.1 hypothetical protein GLOTRDRAFT_93627 [Gloeophyllum trabeum ATCC 11539]